KGFEKAYPHQLSGGMQQRAAMARALAYAPSFIMTDEPFASLDHFTRNQMQKELMKLQQKSGASILFVTHSIDEALLLGHKIAIIENGLVKREFLIDETERDLLSPAFIEMKREIISELNL
ncbi:MAG: ATP-binding cassette domain-containing protein, partial [Anaerotignum sp.]|nr:ATP-binding cassette domain-containing protein [Anaerotignum sp.]